MDRRVEITEAAEGLLAVVSDNATESNLRDKITPLFDQVYAFLKTEDVKQTGQNVILYWDERDKQLLFTAAGLRIQVGVQISEPFESDGTVSCSATPAGTIATTTHWGPYSEIPQAHGAIRQWCRDNRRSIAGPNWEVYGDWSDDPAQLRTDICYLLESGART